MTKLITSFSAIAVLLLVNMACTTDETTSLREEMLEQLQDTSIPENLGGVREGGLTLPDGTTPSLSADKSTLNYQLPDHIIYVAMNDAKLSTSSKGSFTCTSNCAGGCDVVKFGDQLGCSACPEGSTDSCVGTRGLAGFAVGDGQGGGFIDLNAGVSFVTDVETISHLDGPDWEVLVGYQDVASQFDVFYEQIWGNRDPEREQTQLALVDVFGTQIRMKVPAELSSSGRSAVLAAEKVTCVCSSGTNGCKYEEIKKGIIKVGDKCVAGECTSCTMNF